MAVSLAPESKAEAEQHAKQDAPLEACGLVFVDAKGKQHYQACQNLCDEPEKHFVLDPVGYYKASLRGKIIAVVHSHPNGEPPSDMDRKACKQSKLTWFIYQLPQDEWLTIEP